MINPAKNITLSSEELMQKYGKYYIVIGDTVYEAIGVNNDLYPSEYHFESFEKAKAKALLNCKFDNELALKKLQEKVKSVSFNWNLFLSKINLINQKKKNEIHKLKNDYELLIKDKESISHGTFDIKTIKQKENFIVPNNLLDLKQQYYYINFDNNFEIHESKFSKVNNTYNMNTFNNNSGIEIDIIFDFSILFEDIVVKLNIDDILQSNESYWKLENKNEYIFSDKKTAEQFIIDFSLQKIDYLKNEIHEIESFIRTKLEKPDFDDNFTHLSDDVDFFYNL